jgi:hypothetical protein
MLVYVIETNIEKSCKHSSGYCFDPNILEIGLMFSRSNLNMGHLGSNTKSHCFNIENPCKESRGHIFFSPVMKLGQNACLGNCSDEFDGSGERSMAILAILFI